jgi:hypothetical protein
MADQRDPEGEFFRRQNQEKLQKLKEQAAQEQAAAEAAELKELHYLHCGKCGELMETTLFKGIEIEICRSCGAVLLDPGELEELVGQDEGGVVKTLGDFFRFARRSG